MRCVDELWLQDCSCSNILFGRYVVDSSDVRYAVSYWEVCSRTGNFLSTCGACAVVCACTGTNSEYRCGLYLSGTQDAMSGV